MKRRLFFYGSLGVLALLLAGWLARPGMASTPTINFYPKVDYELSGSEPKEMVIADFNGDEHLDMAVTMAGTGGKITVMLGDGSGAFADEPFPIGFSPWGIDAADLNGDGVPDLVATESGHDNTGVGIFTGDGSGGFVLWQMVNAGKFPVAVHVADYNEDGVLDLAVANNVLYGVSILLGNGDGSFAAAQHIPGQASLMSTDMAAADVNHDDHLDLIVSHYGGVIVFAGAGDGSFAPVGTAGNGYLNEAVAVGDLNNDAHMDIASIDLYSNILLINLGNGDGTFQGYQAYPMGANMRDVLVHDLNLDGDADVAVANEAGNNVGVLLGLGDGTLMPAQYFATGLQPGIVAAGDWDEDGFPDLAVPWRNLGETPWVSVLLQIPSDQQGPTMTIDAPAAGSIVSGMTPVEVTATDPSGVRFVLFRVDATFIGFDVTAPYQVNWNTAAFANGPHRLTVLGRDNAGNWNYATEYVFVYNP